MPTMLQTDDCDSVARALIRGVDAVFMVTGQPVTHLIDIITNLAAHAEISVNEKCAVEAAVGMAAVGGRAAVIVKHCGLAYALDSLANAAVHGTGGALIVVSGDDCDASHSTRIYDSRDLAEIAEVPVMDFALNGDVDEVTEMAVRVSASHGVPVVVRVTARLHASCGTKSPVSTFVRKPAAARSHARGVDTEVAHGLTKLGRHQHHRQAVVAKVREINGQAPMIERSCSGKCSDALIVVGDAIRYVSDTSCCRLIVRGSWPMSPRVVDFLRLHDRTLVVEEPRPCLEIAIRAELTEKDPVVLGRLSGHFPPEGLLSEDLVSGVLAGGGPQAWTAVARKPAASSNQSVEPYGSLFEAVARLHRAGVFVAADVGSAVRLCYPPYAAASVALSLGSAVGVAGGAARAGYRAVAVVGDYALTHSALESVLECARLDLPVLIVVLANNGQAQTGGQVLPEANRAALMAACGVTNMADMVAVDPTAIFNRLRAIICEGLPAAVFVRPRMA
jgi:indolepyruvate ferredoxin oxidoreductase, alpha subunit